MKALCEEYEADITAIDYRGQTPLHVTTSCGELGAMLYMGGRLISTDRHVLLEAKDNALMTPLMNTIANSNVTGFIYLFFGEHCSLNNVDINGNTILHLAAKSNSINIVKLLHHVFIAGKKKDAYVNSLMKPNAENEESD